MCTNIMRTNCWRNRLNAKMVTFMSTSTSLRYTQEHCRDHVDSANMTVG